MNRELGGTERAGVDRERERDNKKNERNDKNKPFSILLVAMYMFLR